jgi:TonB family protein
MRKSFLLGLVTILLACGLSVTAAGADEPIAKILTDRYHEKTLNLRHSFISSSQKYDADGQPLVDGQEGSWTLYGRVSVAKVSIGSDALRVEGNRVTYRFSEEEKRFMPFPDRERVKIEIRLSNPLTSEDAATAVLGRVFALTEEDIVQSAPQYWRAYLKRSAAQNPEGGGLSQKPPPGETRANVGPGGVFRVGDLHVTPPRATYSPEPEFSEIARRSNFQGSLSLDIIVDAKGQVSNVSIFRPLGMGLDESAVETVRQWRFTPAMKDGSPVAVQIYVEIDFRLYKRKVKLAQFFFAYPDFVLT